VTSLRRLSPFAAAGLVSISAGLVFTRSLGTRTNYDEGVYLASLDALRRGQALGSEVYTSQPPGFYALLRLLAWPGGTSIEGIRLAFALVAVAGVVAATVVGWRLLGAWAGVAAGALVAIGPPYPSVSRTIASDVPSVALGLVALAFACLAVTTDSRRSKAWAIAAGAALGLAFMTKVLALPFAVPLVAIVLSRRRGRSLLPLVAASVTAVVGVFLLVHASALGEIWTSVIGDHSNAKKAGSASANLHLVARLLEPRTPFGWLVPAGFGCFLFVRRARDAWPLWTLVPAAWAFLIFIRPLADHHFVLLAAAYGLAAGSSLALAAAELRPQLRVIAVSTIALFFAAGLFQEQRRLHHNDAPESPEIVWAVDEIGRETRPNELVTTDQPIVAWKARRALPGALVDVSSTRVTGGTLTADEILREIDKASPVAVLEARMFRSLPVVTGGLSKRYPVKLRCGDATLYLKRPSTQPVAPCHE
jgi:4-amino-4-deoxy-L-arabinose transferase-like glycosyltransferase